MAQRQRPANAAINQGLSNARSATKFSAVWAAAKPLYQTAQPDRPANTSLRLLAVLNVLSSMPPLVKRRAPRTDGPLTHFASPRGEKSGLDLNKS